MAFLPEVLYCYSRAPSSPRINRGHHKLEDKCFLAPFLFDSSHPEKLKDLEESRSFSSLERVRGVEPLSNPWQGLIIAAIRYPPTLRLDGQVR